MNLHVDTTDNVKRGPGRPRGVPGKKKDVYADPKYQHVRSLYLGGMTYEEIGRRLGVTRQRVEQMARKMDLVPQRKRLADRRAVVAGTIVRKGLTSRQAVDMFGVTFAYVYMCCREHGVEPADMTAEERTEFDAMAAKVISGSSLRAAAKGDEHKAQKLRQFLVERGVDAKGRSRHDDFQHRFELLGEWRSAGLTWKECAKRLSEHDGRPIGWQALSHWCHRHMPHLFETSETAA